MAASHVEELLKDKLFAIVLLRGQARNTTMYVYVAVRLDRLDILHEAYAQGAAIEPTEFGRVLASGMGEPDADTVQAMLEQYHFRPDDVVVFGE